MYYWQITKYNPKNRNKHGIYLKDEWTEYTDIGKIFDGKKITYEEYVKVENNYIQAALLFMDCLNIDSLKVISLEKHGENPDSIIVDNVTIINNQSYKKEFISFIIQSILRNKFWCMLESETGNMRIRFDYDYYMTIGCSMFCANTLEKIENLGLFVEYEDPVYLFE